MTLNIRNATANDVQPLTDIYNYYVENTHATFDLNPVTVESRLEWLQHYNKTPIRRLLVGEADGKVIGYACASEFRARPAYDKSAETTIYLDHKQQGKGYGRLLYTRLLGELERTDLHRCYGIITLPNPGSVALHTAVGFREIGTLNEVGFKFEKYWDTLWMERQLD